MDGQQQRKALSAAESALRALAAGDAGRARTAAEKAVALDQLGVYGAFAGWVRRAAGEIEQGEGCCRRPGRRCGIPWPPARWRPRWRPGWADFPSGGRERGLGEGGAGS